MTADEIDAIGNAAFERRDITTFSMILQHISLDQRELLLERATEERQIFFAALLSSSHRLPQGGFAPANGVY